MITNEKNTTQSVKFTITSVGDYIAKMKKCDQPTLTQMLGLPTEGDSGTDPDDDFVNKPAFVTPQPKRKVNQIHSPAPKKTTKILKKKITHKVGDLVTSTAAEIGHPDYKSSRIGAGYIFFGLVVGNPEDQSSIYFNKNPDYINVKWCATEPGHTLIKSANISVKIDTQIFDQAIIAVMKENIRTIARRHNPHLENVNMFIKTALLEEYYFVEPLGWCCVYDLE